MKKKIISTIAMCLVLAGVMQGNSVAAKTTEFNKTKIGMSPNEDSIPMSIGSDGNICIYQYEDDGYDATNDEYYYNIRKYTWDGNSTEMSAKIYECHDQMVNYAEEIENGEKTIVVSDIEKYKYRLKTYNKEGEVIADIEDRFYNKKDGSIHIHDLVIKNNKIYYAYSRYDTINKKLVQHTYIRCIDSKTGKVIYNKLLGESDNFDAVKMNDERVYMIEGDMVKSYILNGKKEVTYKLPKVKRRFRQSIALDGKYLYYTNGKNGIYRCNINKPKKGFSLYYNTKKDSNFNKKKFYDFYVKDNNTFFVRFMEGVEDYGDPTLVIKYSR